MAVITWDNAGERYYEMGVTKGVLYPYDKTENAYKPGVAWNGLTSVTESPDGAEATDLWADDIKYASFRSIETFGGSIEAYTYPKEFEECDGTKSLGTGVTIGQQARSKFGLSYRTAIGSDTDTEHSQYKLHLVYGATASVSEKAYETINDSPDAITFSWDFETDPVTVSADGFKATSLVTIDSRYVSAAALTAIETALYGTESEDPYLPLPDEIITMLSTSTEDTEEAT